jgi:AraC family transcriptional regulator
MIIDVPSNAQESNTILHEKGYRNYYAQGTGALSIKSFFNGRAFYEVGQNRYLVGNDMHLILNSGQCYTIHIDVDQPIESFCIFFADGFAEEIHHDLTTPDVLDTPFKGKSSLNFFEKTYPQNPYLTPTLLQLRAGSESGCVTKGWIEEHMQLLMQGLLHTHYNVYRQVELLSAIRPATREELYRRLHYARDYAVALFNTPVTLAEIANVAALSPNHLMRTFKQLFGQTPHQFIVTKRIEEAQRLLSYSDSPVTEICFAVGFESLGTFSTLFTRRVGLSPTEYRNINRSIKR